ncbi:MAG: secretin N-terminal domain-containing protein [Halanaerobiales bacterium]
MRNYRRLIIFICLFIFIGQVGIMAANVKINMNFKGADIRDVLRTIAELANVNLVTDSSVRGEVTVHLKNLTFEEALTLVTQVHGLAYKWYGNTVVVATPERIEDLYSTIEIRTVAVKHADLLQLQDILRNLYPELNIVPDQRNNRLILQGKGELIQDAEKLLALLDTEKEAVADVIAIPADKGEFLLNYLRKVYPDLFVESDGRGNFVLYGSPYDLENARLLLSKLMEQLGETAGDYQTGDVVESIRVRYVEVSYIKELINEMYPDVNVIADSKNNQLIYSGPAYNLQRIKGLVSIIDLDYGLVDDEDAAVMSGAERVTRIYQIDYATIDDIEGIIKELYPGLLFRTNTQKKEIILHGRRDELDEVVALLEMIDTPRKQVIIEVRVEEVSTTDLLDLGVNPDELSRIELIDKNRDGYIDGVGLTFPQFISILETQGRSNTLARPRLMTLSGEEASLLIGDRIPVTVEKVEDDKVITTVEYIEAGINLVFTPWVTSDNKINLRVNPQVSSIGESIGTALPPINTREAETNIRLDDGETFAIGGLIQDDIIESVKKVPILGDIPILGHLFKSRSTQNIKSELIIFITPHIVKEDEIVETIQENLKSREIISESIEQMEEKSATIVEEEKIGIAPEEILAMEEVEIIREQDKGEEVKEEDDKAEPVNTEYDVVNIRKEENDTTGQELVLLSSEEIKAILGKNEARRKTIQLNSPTENPGKEEEKKDSMAGQRLQEEELPKKGINLDNYYLYDYVLDRFITIEELAEMFTVDQDLILEANKDVELSIGAKVKIPVEKSRIYIMEKGDTLWKIHTIYGVSVEAIKKLNNIVDESNIPVGTIIIIPEEI